MGVGVGNSCHLLSHRVVHNVASAVAVDSAAAAAAMRVAVPCQCLGLASMLGRASGTALPAFGQHLCFASDSQVHGSGGGTR
ncbi:hypothetical protein C0Q70_05833 [Pomacea canaliculata]|uniref:Uncharacterized protein n=1 Tax=Pomacea canaliculata TaxID=400727 RepID=A0A2T7PMF1_POMCA|nr:hypothetical protein C0Q70_05833 [Pomacea canaliculata]